MAKWVKLDVNILDDEKVMVIRSMPEGPTLFVIWIGLLCLAGRCNDGGLIYLSERMPYTDETLGTVCSCDASIVRLALETFERLGMIETLDNGQILLANWEKYQNEDRLEQIRRSTRERVAKHREKKRLEASNVTRNKKVTPSNAVDIEVEREEELEKDIKNKKYKNTSLSGKPDDTVLNMAKRVIGRLNERMGTSYKPEAKATLRLISARMKEGATEQEFRQAIGYCIGAWRDDPKMRDFIRPSTIFTGKMESYVQNFKNRLAELDHEKIKTREARR